MSLQGALLLNQAFPVTWDSEDGFFRSDCRVLIDMGTMFLVELEGSKSGQLFRLHRTSTVSDGTDVSPSRCYTKGECIIRLIDILANYTYAKIVKFRFPFSSTVGPFIQTKLRQAIALYNPSCATTNDTALLLCIKNPGTLLMEGKWILDISEDDLFPVTSTNLKVDVCDMVTAPIRNMDGTKNLSNEEETKFPIILKNPVSMRDRVWNTLFNLVKYDKPIKYDDSWLKADNGIVVSQRVIRSDGEVCEQRAIYKMYEMPKV